MFISDNFNYFNRSVGCLRTVLAQWMVYAMNVIYVTNVI